MISPLVLASAVFTLQNGVQNKDIAMQFVSDVLKQNFQITQINAFLCWDKGDQLNFTQKLFEENRGISIQDMDSDPIPHYGFNTHYDIYLVDLDCRSSFDLLVKANYKKLFVSPYKWFLLSNNDIHTLSNGILKKLNILIDSHVVLGLQTSSTDFTLHEVYKINHTSLVLTDYIANWTSDIGFVNYVNGTLSSRRTNLMGHVIPVSIVATSNETHKHLWDYREKHVDPISKLNTILGSILLDHLNGTKKYLFADSWGYKNATERWFKGMIGAMQIGKAELGGTGAMLSHERLVVLDYLAPTTPSEIQFLFRQPPLSYVSNLFTLPFERTVWISTFCFVLLATLLIYFVTVWERHHQIHDTEMQDDSIFEVIMLSVGAVCQQGTTYEPKSATGMLITFLVFISLLFIYVSYSAYIVVLLQSSSTQIQTVQDLLESKLEFGALDVVYNYYYLKVETDPIRHALYNTKLAPLGDKLFMSLEEGVKRLRAGFFAFHAELPSMYTFVGRMFLEAEKCSLQNIKFIQTSQFWAVVRKKSIFKKMFKIVYRKMHERGIQQREQARLFDSKPRCLGSGNLFVTVGLGDAAPAFFFLAAGMAVALLVFALELLAHKYLRSKPKK